MIPAKHVDGECDLHGAPWGEEALGGGHMEPFGGHVGGFGGGAGGGCGGPGEVGLALGGFGALGDVLEDEFGGNLAAVGYGEGDLWSGG